MLDADLCPNRGQGGVEPRYTTESRFMAKWLPPVTLLRDLGRRVLLNLHTASTYAHTHSSCMRAGGRKFTGC